MEKMILNDTLDRNRAISFYGEKYKNEIKEVVSQYPCMLIAFYSEDIEWGNGYSFDIITIEDFQKPNAEVF
jgi:hypothetical protein